MRKNKIDIIISQNRMSQFALGYPIFILLLLVSCSLNNKEISKSELIQEGFILSIDSAGFHHAIKKVVKIGEKEYFLLFDKRNEKIHFFETESLQLIKSKEIPDSDKIIDIDYHSCDTIYFLLKGNVIAIADSNFVPYFNFMINSKRLIELILV